MVNRILGHVDGRNIVTVDKCLRVDRNAELTKEMMEPAALGSGVGDATALERETTAWRLEDQDTRESPRNTQKPDVERPVSGHLAQSASE